MGLRYESLADMPQNMRNRVAGHLAAKEAAAKKNKYRNQPTNVGVIRFDSKKEADRYLVLMDAIKGGVIYDLRLQQNFTLQEAYTTADGQRVRSIVYQADFTYRIRWPWYRVPTSCAVGDLQYWSHCAQKSGEGALVVEDVKSTATRTRVYVNKKKMMANLGHIIREV